MRGNGSVFKRGNVFWMKFYRDGVPVSISCKTGSKEVAKSLLRAELRKSDDEFTEPRFKRVTIGELFGLYLDKLEAEGKDGYRKIQLGRYNNHLRSRVEHMKATQMNSEFQHTLRKDMLKEGYAAATINRMIEILAASFNVGYEMEPPLVKRMPKFHFTKEENVRRVFATPEQMAAIKREAANPKNYKGAYKVTPLHTRTFIEIAHLFGWRMMEILNLKVSNVRRIEGTIRIEDSKNGDAREVAMPPSIKVLVDALVTGKTGDERLFPFTGFAMWNTWLKVVKAAGCEHLHIHDLRRTSARSKRAAGVDTSVTMAIMGWKTDKMFRRYGIVAQDDIAVAMNKQDQYENAIAAQVVN